MNAFCAPCVCGMNMVCTTNDSNINLLPSGDGGLLHVGCCGLGVVRVGARQVVDGSGDQSPANSLEQLGLPDDGGDLLGHWGPCRRSGVLCDSVGWAPVCEGVEPPLQEAGLEVVPGLVVCVVADAFGVPCGDGDGAACVPSVVSGEEW